MNFRGKVALVTGAASGIGRASALAFAREGAAVVLADVDRDGGLETLACIEALGVQGLFVVTDVSKGDQVADLMERLVQRFGRLDFAHNNAGICGAPLAFRDTSEAWFDRVMAINVKGVWLAMKQEVELLAAGGGGAIVNTASVAGSKSFKDFSSYAVSKHAIVGLTKTVAVEVAPLGIRVNAVCPGIIETPMVTSEAGPETLARVLAKVPMARMGQPEEVAQTVIFLCGGGAGFTTGQTIVIDGGATA